MNILQKQYMPASCTSLYSFFLFFFCLFVFLICVAIPPELWCNLVHIQCSRKVGRLKVLKPFFFLKEVVSFSHSLQH